jgi:hypothetical protein
MRARDMVVVAGLLLLVVGCPKPAPPAQPVAEEEEEEEVGNQDVVDPEVYERVTAAFEAKRNAVGRCFADALADGKIERKAKGTVTFEMTITTGGKASNVKPVKDSLKSAEVTDCATQLIESWELPKPETPMPFSFIYNFEEQ